MNFYRIDVVYLIVMLITKIQSVSIALMLFLTSLGIPLHIHFCQDTYESISIFQEDAGCCEDEKCCSDELLRVYFDKDYLGNDATDIVRIDVSLSSPTMYMADNGSGQGQSNCFYHDQPPIKTYTFLETMVFRL